MMLAAITLTPLAIAFVILAVVAGVGAGVIWYRRDEAKEDRDRARIDLAALLREAKLPHMADIVIDVAVRDWDGLYRHIKALKERAAEPGQLVVMLNENFRWQLGERWKMPEWRTEISAFVADQQAAEKVRESQKAAAAK